MNSDLSKTVDVSVIIVTYNSEGDIKECLDGVYRFTKKASFEVVVLDNCSTDNTVNAIRSNFPEVNPIIPEENLGFARGVNRATLSARGKYILLLNPDTKIFNDAIGEIFQFAEKRPQHGLFGARTLTPDRTLQPVSCLGLPSIWSMLMFASGLSTVFKSNSIFDPESLGNWQRDSERVVGSIVGCFLLCKRELWLDLKGFDESFYMYGEDVDLAIRAKQLGYASVICPQSELIHEFGNSSKTPVHKLILLYKGKITLAKKHWKGLSRELAISCIKTGILLRALPSIISIKRDKNKYHQLWNKKEEWGNGYKAKPIQTFDEAHADLELKTS